MSAEDKREIKSILTKFHEKKTILLFSANDDISDIADSIFEVERGRVHLQKIVFSIIFVFQKGKMYLTFFFLISWFASTLKLCYS